MSTQKYWNHSPGIGIFVTSCLAFLLFGCLADITGEKAYAQEKILLKGVPYVYQRWHFD